MRQSIKRVVGMEVGLIWYMLVAHEGQGRLLGVDEAEGDRG